MNVTDTTANVAFDTKSLDNLKIAARNDSSPETIKEVAKQFEAVFMNMLMKSMRAATPQESPFDNEQTRTFTAMLDQQLSSNLSQRGLGLSDIIARQLTKGINPTGNAMEQAVSSLDATNEPVNQFTPSHLSPNAHLIQGYLDQISASNAQLGNASDNAKSAADALLSRNVAMLQSFNATSRRQVNDLPNQSINSIADFKNIMTKHADIASAKSGIPSQLMLGQAALESGWGKRQIKGQDGTESYNLFGIKANKGWDGKVVETLTTEYINGVKQKRVEQFRAYDSYADSFADFAKLMTDNPRYKNVLNNLDNPAAYANAMQKAGYATDPNYAQKLTNVIQKFTDS